MYGDWLVVVGDDGTQQATRVIAVWAAHDMRALQLVEAILLFCGPFVDVGDVGFAATRHGHVEQRAGGVLASTAWVVSAVTPWAECTVRA